MNGVEQPPSLPSRDRLDLTLERLLASHAASSVADRDGAATSAIEIHCTAPVRCLLVIISLDASQRINGSPTKDFCHG